MKKKERENDQPSSNRTISLLAKILVASPLISTRITTYNLQYNFALKQLVLMCTYCSVYIVDAFNRLSFNFSPKANNNED